MSTTVTAAGVLGGVLRRMVGRLPGAHVLPLQRCVRREVRTADELREAVSAVSGAVSSAHIAKYLRELAELNTPALLLNIVEKHPRVHVRLRPFDGGRIRFRGASWFVEAGSGSAEGVEAFLATPFAHTTALYPGAPDHPVHVISLEYHGERIFTGDVPSWLTHFTLLVNGAVLARAEPVLHERGIQTWTAWAAERPRTTRPSRR